jgi:hypothetical protein
MAGLAPIVLLCYDLRYLMNYFPGGLPRKFIELWYIKVSCKAATAASYFYLKGSAARGRAATAQIYRYRYSGTQEKCTH